MATWQLQDAKNRFGELVDKALRVGPQVVTRRGKKAVVVVSVAEYRRLTRPKENLVDFFRKPPLHGEDLDVTRAKGTAREVAL